MTCKQVPGETNGAVYAGANVIKCHLEQVLSKNHRCRKKQHAIGNKQLGKCNLCYNQIQDWKQMQGLGRAIQTLRTLPTPRVSLKPCCVSFAISSVAQQWMPHVLDQVATVLHASYAKHITRLCAQPENQKWEFWGIENERWHKAEYMASRGCFWWQQWKRSWVVLDIESMSSLAHSYWSRHTCKRYAQNVL